MCRREAVLPIEVIDSSVPRGRFRSELFDFDGTLSLVREGADAIVPEFREHRKLVSYLWGEAEEV